MRGKGTRIILEEQTFVEGLTTVTIIKKGNIQTYKKLKRIYTNLTTSA